MKIILMTLFLVFLISISICSCKKEKTLTDTVKPGISFYSPDSYKLYSYPDTIVIQCKAEDDIKLKEFSVSIKNTGTGKDILNCRLAVSEKSCTINTFYCINDSIPSIYILSSKAIDAFGNELKRDLYLHINHQNHHKNKKS